MPAPSSVVSDRCYLHQNMGSGPIRQDGLTIMLIFTVAYRVDDRVNKNYAMELHFAVLLLHAEKDGLIRPNSSRSWWGGESWNIKDVDTKDLDTKMFGNYQLGMSKKAKIRYDRPKDIPISKSEKAGSWQTQAGTCDHERLRELWQVPGVQTAAESVLETERQWILGLFAEAEQDATIGEGKDLLLWLQTATKVRANKAVRYTQRLAALQAEMQAEMDLVAKDPEFLAWVHSEVVVKPDNPEGYRPKALEAALALLPDNMPALGGFRGFSTCLQPTVKKWLEADRVG